MSYQPIRVRSLSIAIAGILLLCGCFSVSAQAELVLPKTPFNMEEAFQMLNAGTSEIKGVAFTEDRVGLIRRKVSDDNFARPGTVVTLYPITSYFAEYLELRKKDKPGKRVAGISNVANSFRVVTKVHSEKGDFVFKGLKPGTYYLEVSIPAAYGTVIDVSGIADIKSEGETVSIQLKGKAAGFR